MLRKISSYILSLQFIKMIIKMRYISYDLTINITL